MARADCGLTHKDLVSFPSFTVNRYIKPFCVCASLSSSRKLKIFASFVFQLLFDMLSYCVYDSLLANGMFYHLDSPNLKGFLIGNSIIAF
jgi:hypothetical protein